jgi:predicted RNA binding protein YcfA (HicA-like mRNA interferase family)
MSKLPVITGKEAIKAFEKLGYVIVKISSSHCNMKKEGNPIRISVPVHAGKTLRAGTLRAIIRSVGITKEEFCEALD